MASRPRLIGTAAPATPHAAAEGSPESAESPGQSGTASSTRRTDWLVVAGLVVLAAALRLPTLGRAYWIDEGISVGIGSHPLSQIPGLMKMDGSPPGWYILLHFWMQLLGSSEAATHTLPLLISLVIIPVAYWLGRDLFGRPAGLAAAALCATNP
ncbi:MAG: glycosyltransferase family 39 protein, partial [Acidimicrobiales bacterium]